MDNFQKAREALRRIEEARQAEAAARRELAVALGELGLHSQSGQAAFLEQGSSSQIAPPSLSGDNHARPTQRQDSLDALDLPSELEHPVEGEIKAADPWAALIEETDELGGEDAVPFPQE